MLFPPGATTYEPVPLDAMRATGLCFDMHVHTVYSDGSTTVRRAVERAVELGIGLAITDHNEIRGSIDAEIVAAGRVPILPGIEVNSREGRDLLVYFHTHDDLRAYFEEEVEPYIGFNPSGPLHRGIIDLARTAKTYRGLVVAAHPFGVVSFGKKNLVNWIARNGDEVLEHIDGVETNNGAAGVRNEFARAWAIEHCKVPTGGSDAHTIAEIGKIITCAPVATRTEFIDALLQGAHCVNGPHRRAFDLVAPTIMITKRHLPYFIPGLRYLMRANDPRVRGGRRRRRSSPAKETAQEAALSR